MSNLRSYIIPPINAITPEPINPAIHKKNNTGNKNGFNAVANADQKRYKLLAPLAAGKRAYIPRTKNKKENSK